MRVRNLKNKREVLQESCYVISNPEDYKNKWKKYFNNDNPICLEIGTGKCSFIYEMARKYPNSNFIGIERIDSVLAYGIKEIEKFPKLNNLVLINYDALSIEKLFNKEINEVFLNFSDPWPKKRHEKRRLTSFSFLKKYDIIFFSDRKLMFKTDNRELFEYSIVSLSNYGYLIEDISLDLHSRKDINNVMTEYEKKYSSKGCTIYMLKAIKKI